MLKPVFAREIKKSRKDSLFNNLPEGEVGMAIEFTSNPRFKFGPQLIDAMDLTSVRPDERNINFLIFKGEDGTKCVYLAFWNYVPDIGQGENPSLSTLITRVNKTLKGNNKPEVENLMSLLGVPQQEGTSEDKKYHLLKAEVVENPFEDFQTASLILKVTNQDNEESNSIE